MKTVRERNKMELAAWVAAVAVCATGLVIDRIAGGELVIAASDRCEQIRWGGDIPPAFDPNAIQGTLIDVQRVTAGKYNRTGPCCDPNDDPFDVELIEAPAGFSVRVDPNAGTWTIAGELPIGVYAIIARAIDRPEYRKAQPKSRTVTILVEAVEPFNAPPVLQ